MPPAALKGTGITVLYPIDLPSKFTKETIEKWIRGLRGVPMKKVSEGTTHLVCTEKHWRSQCEAVQEALSQLDDDGKRRIKIVSQHWLEEALDNSRKPKEGAFLWEKLDREAMVATEKKRKVLEKMEKSSAAKSGTAQGMMKEVFVESTEKFVDKALQAKIAKEAERKREEAAELAKAEKERKDAEVKKRKRDELGAVFGRGAKKARNEIFSNNHHIYTDATGFKFDVLLTKVDTRQNRNQRYALTIYESNSSPATYALNLQFAGTGLLPSNNILAAIGCPYATAWRVFKKAFKEKTGFEWDERVIRARERASKDKRAPAAQAEREEAFEDKKFVYDPPRFGPKGELPVEQQETAQVVLPAMGGQSGEKTQVIEAWMSGANGSGGTPPPPPTDAHTPAQMQEEENDFIKDTSATKTHQTQPTADFDMDKFMADVESHVPPGPAHDESLQKTAEYPFERFDFESAAPGAMSEIDAAWEAGLFGTLPSFTVPEVPKEEVLDQKVLDQRLLDQQLLAEQALA